VAVSTAEQCIDEPEHLELLWRLWLPGVACIFLEVELRMNRKVAEDLTSVTCLGGIGSNLESSILIAKGVRDG
jgi:hypothetical protein